MGRKKLPATRSQAMRAQCHECMGHYVDGKMDCQCVNCPLYPWMPYRKLEPNWAWVKYDRTKKGLKEKSKKKKRKEKKRRERRSDK